MMMFLKGLGCMPRCSQGSHRYGGSISIFTSTGYISVFFIYLCISIYSHVGQSVYKYIYIYTSLTKWGKSQNFPLGNIDDS